MSTGLYSRLSKRKKDYYELKKRLICVTCRNKKVYKGKIYCSDCRARRAKQRRGKKSKKQLIQ